MGRECCMVITVLAVLAWLVCVSCPLGCVCSDYGGAHYFTILMLITGITMCYPVFAKCGSCSSVLTVEMVGFFQ
jgi:hypothetical protein